MRFKLGIFLLTILVYSNSIAQLSPKWTIDTHSPVYGSVTSVDDMIYVGNDAGELYAISRDGKVLWKKDLDGGIKSTPAVSGNNVIINTTEGTLYRLNRKNGKIIWRIKLGEERRYDLWDYYLSSPVVEGDRIFVGTGDGNIHCADLKTGRKIWYYQMAGIVHATPVLNDHYLYVGGFDGFLYRINKYDGSLSWAFDTGGSPNYPKGEIQKAVEIRENKVYVACRGNYLYEIDLVSGAELRRYQEKGSWIIATPTFHGNSLVFGTSDSQVIRNLSLDDFEVTWTTPVSMRVYGKIAEYDDRFYLGTFDGKILILNQSGEIVSNFQTETSLQNYKLIYEEDGKFRADILNLYGSNMAAAEKLLLTLGGFALDPLIVNGELFMADLAGRIYCFDIKK